MTGLPKANLSLDFITKLRDGFHSDAANPVRMHAVMKGGVNDASENRAEKVENPLVFSIEIEPGKITDQNHSGRCWLFAALNTFRIEVMRKLNLETFELSQSWAMFWDKVERSNYVLESILETLEEPADGRLVAHLLHDPIGDGGQWDMFCALVDKYGVVPKDVMPETFHSGDSRMMNALITRKLREDALALRTAAAAGEGMDALRQKKEAQLAEIFGLLCLCLGEPPERFDFEWRDKDKAFHGDLGITPKQFFERYVGLNLDDYVSVINAPTADKPYYRTFTVQHLGNVRGGRAVKYLNLPVEEQKALAIAQLQDNQPVWFGCDVGKMLDRKNGLMGVHTFDYASLGVRLEMDKAQRLDYYESVMTHAMVLLGVNLVDGKPNRWKVENSWGEDSGLKGYYVMTDEWFGEFNYQIVVHKKYLSPEQRMAWDTVPIELKPWDPMGTLA
jgi:bleomycin hydrolase